MACRRFPTLHLGAAVARATAIPRGTTLHQGATKKDGGKPPYSTTRLGTGSSCILVAEEIGYRGVAMSILWYSLGSRWLAGFICAAAFAAAHWIQGAKSGVVLFAIANQTATERINLSR